MKVALLMSGGVDSSYCAHLLSSQGYEVIGLYLKLHDKEKKHNIFIKNCQQVSERLGIAFEVVDLREAFKQNVYDSFVRSYKEGQTPNPCAICNPLMKFGLGLQKADELGCDYIATGHYAQIKEVEGIKRIAKAVDDTKDQSYFLYALPQEAIDRIIFPLGGFYKEDVKKTALNLLPFLGTLQTYKESQEICFVEESYIDILKLHEKVDEEGIVRDTQGKAVGKHKGYMHYTIGKRKGFSVFGSHEPHYVKAINPLSNEIVVGTKEELAVDSIKALNKSLPQAFNGGVYDVKVRYRSVPLKAQIDIDGDYIHAQLLESAYGVAQGQALVLYQGDCVLGGGVITQAQ
ncbi:tRNA 2-thiouridine(34) synthase MnmA [Helicobacter jaachi]|uniref:tRNA-specific 2-thiouridylase MnmA n=1 Tax=Helicobacter jaachi TaxID=1677920 RepID=A0A4U8TAR7_9HELI|nr:tRNA 2-thiouridine(34) synthase MnmA [Helicobacter jaachi]TLD96774.1 tRNA 2-thiouridine(34) synthase MnmA [Helicobacter jaachi]